MTIFGPVWPSKYGPEPLQSYSVNLNKVYDFNVLKELLCIWLEINAPWMHKQTEKWTGPRKRGRLVPLLSGISHRIDLPPQTQIFNSLCICQPFQCEEMKFFNIFASSVLNVALPVMSSQNASGDSFTFIGWHATLSSCFGFQVLHSLRRVGVHRS